MFCPIYLCVIIDSIYISIMDLRHLRAFVAVAEELHFGRAARRLGIAQPPLSLTIRQLERELNTRLFERSSRKVALTREGTALVEGAQRLLRGVVDWKQDAISMSRGDQGLLRIGFVSASMDGKLPEAIRRFRADRPRVEFELRLMDSETQKGALRRRELDLGILRAYQYALSEFDVTTYHSERYVAGIPSGHSLAKRKSISARAVRGESLIMLPRRQQPALRAALEQGLTAKGEGPRSIQEVDLEATAVALAAASVGIAIVPQSSTQYARAGVVFRPIRAPLPPAEFDAVVPRASSWQAARDFVSYLL